MPREFMSPENYAYVADNTFGLMILDSPFEEVIPPTVTDNQTGDNTWRSSDPGAIYDVDFSDTGGSNLKNAQYAVWSKPGMAAGTGTQLISWTNIATGINAAAYTANWGVAFASLSEGVNYVSVRAYDNAGNVSAVATDVFYVKKNTTPPADTTPPTNISTVNDGTGADIDTATSASQLSANWSPSSDPESGIARYLCAVGTTAGATDVVDGQVTQRQQQLRSLVYHLQTDILIISPSSRKTVSDSCPLSQVRTA